MTPLEQCFYLIVDEMGEMVLWLSSYNLFGVRIVYYFVGITIMAILFDRIF